MRAPGLPATLCAAGKARPRLHACAGLAQSGPFPPRFPDVKMKGDPVGRKGRFSSVSSGLVAGTSAPSAVLCDAGDWQGDPVCTQERHLDTSAALRGGGLRTVCDAGDGPGWQSFPTAACDPFDPKINVVGHGQRLKKIKQYRIKKTSK